MRPKDSNMIFSWSANSVVNFPILFAVVGFIYSVIVFKGGFGKVDFHEVYLQNKDSLSVIIVKNRIDSLTQFINSIEKHKILKIGTKDDTNKYYNTLYNQAKSILKTSHKELKSISNGDSSLKTFIEYANINRDSLRYAITSLEIDPNNSQIKTVCIHLRDTCTFFGDILFDKEIELKFGISEKSLVDFFSNNSIFGFWFFLSIAQMCFWFLLIPLVIGSVKMTDEISLRIPLRYGFNSALIFSIIPTICIVVFTYLLYWNMIDKPIINDIFFMQAYNQKMIFYSIPGYMVAILCFSSYLFLSNKLELLDKYAVVEGDKDEHFKILADTFNFSFLCSAIVLTVFVFWVAILFNAINITEVMQFYRLKTGIPFLNNDFVYLIGLIHSLLLFMFYVPVKIRFNSLKITQKQKQSETAGLTSGRKIWKNILEVLSTILVTTSPLIASFIQKILETLSV
ncbi:hypothetical protein [Xanthocytophaga flava]|nr:hypothetical protein [Xanthocytophaga flavus]